MDGSPKTVVCLSSDRMALPWVKVPKRHSVYVTMITRLTPILCDYILIMHICCLIHKNVLFQYYV